MQRLSVPRHLRRRSGTFTPGSQPCGFDFDNLHPGISLCASVPRISVTNSSLWQAKNVTNLVISSAQLADAGTYTCGNRNPYNLSTTASVIV